MGKLHFVTIMHQMSRNAQKCGISLPHEWTVTAASKLLGWSARQDLCKGKADSMRAQSRKLATSMSRSTTIWLLVMDVHQLSGSFVYACFPNCYMMI